MNTSVYLCNRYNKLRTITLQTMRRKINTKTIKWHHLIDSFCGRRACGTLRSGLTLLLLMATVCWGSTGSLAGNDKLIDYYKPVNEKGFFVHETHYDYSEVARTITSGCTTDYQKIQAIYRWICANISYDTSYTIRTADACIDARKGVCQGYCELFYQIAKAAGVTTEIVGGKSKNAQGIIGKEGHSWLFAYTRPGYGILLDPTWGAGTVEGTTFTRRKDCWTWFNVIPEWMILSHFPDDASYQLISNPMRYSEFASLPPVDNLWAEYGLDTHELFQKARSKQLAMPKFYSTGEGVFQVIDMPMCASLKVGEVYTFRIKMNTSQDFTIINNKLFTKKNEWNDEGGGVYSIRYMVRDVDMLKLSIWGATDDLWWSMIEYKVEEPSRSNWDKVEKYYPLCTPDATKVKDLDADSWEKCGVDGHRLLRLIRESGTRELPVLYTNKGQKLNIVSVPMTKSLKAGDAYTFRFKPLSGCKWALINGDKWYNDWTQSPDGTYEMTISPTQASYLRLSVQFKEGDTYWSCLEYDVR